MLWKFGTTQQNPNTRDTWLKNNKWSITNSEILLHHSTQKTDIMMKRAKTIGLPNKKMSKLPIKVAIDVATDVVFEQAIVCCNNDDMQQAYKLLQVAATLGHGQACYHMGRAAVTGVMAKLQNDPEWHAKCLEEIEKLKGDKL